MSAFTTISDGDNWNDATSFNNLPNLKGPSKTVALVSGADYYCDGSADDVQINAAIVAVNAAGGGIVYVKEGTYDITATIDLLSNVWLVGEGWETILKAKTSLNDQIVLADNQNTCGVMDLCIDGNTANNTSGMGIQFGTATNACYNFVVKNCYVKDVADVGILARKSYYGQISGNLIDGSDGSAISMGYACHDLNVTNNLCLNPDAHGICVSGSAGANYKIVIDGNLVYNAGADGGPTAIGITVDGGSYRVIVSNNVVETTLLACINFENGIYDCVCSGNFVRDSGSGYNGIGIPGDTAACHDIVVTGNFVTDCGGDGIHAHGTSGTESYQFNITGNICLDNTECGIKFNYVDHSVVSGNVCIGNDSGDTAAYDGINLANSDYNLVTGNRCSENDRHEIRIASGTSNFVHNNLLEGTDHTGCFYDAGTNTSVPTKIVPFVDGTAYTDSGWDIDANTEYAGTFFQLPEDYQELVNITIYARCIGDPTSGGGTGMRLEIAGNGGAVDEAYNTEAIAIANKASETCSAADDVIAWIIDSTDDADLGHLAAGDSVEFKVLHEAAGGTDAATDAAFRCIKIRYV